MRKKSIHQTLCRLAALTLVLVSAAAISLTGNAADVPFDGDAPCSLTVKPSGEDFEADMAGADVVLDLYKVADTQKTAGYDSYTYLLNEAYAGLEESLLGADGTVRQDLGNDGWRAIGQEAAKIALNGGDVPVVSGAAAGENQVISALDDGTVLGSGLYLLIARGTSFEDDYVTTVKDAEGNESLATKAQSEHFVYTFAPELITLPTKEAADGAVSTANPGEWIYDLTAQLKPMQDYRLGSLEIVKELTTYETKSPATFVFQVEAVIDGVTVYSDVVSLSFTAPGERSVLIDRIPVGAQVTVTEVYSGASYELTTSASANTVIEANDTVQVRFTNTYNNRRRDGYGINNNFTYDEEGWHWNQWTEVTE